MGTWLLYVIFPLLRNNTFPQIKKKNTIIHNCQRYTCWKFCLASTFDWLLGPFVVLWTVSSHIDLDSNLCSANQFTSPHWHSFSFLKLGIFVCYLLHCDITEIKKIKICLKLSIPSDILYLNSHFFSYQSWCLALPNLSGDCLENFASAFFDDISLCHWLGEMTFIWLGFSFFQTFSL